MDYIKRIEVAITAIDIAIIGPKNLVNPKYFTWVMKYCGLHGGGPLSPIPGNMQHAVCPVHPDHFQMCSTCILRVFHVYS